jgi:hypothetical protein
MHACIKIMEVQYTCSSVHFLQFVVLQLLAFVCYAHVYYAFSQLACICCVLLHMHDCTQMLSQLSDCVVL